MPVLLFFSTLAHHYGYLLFPDLVPVRVYNALTGVWGLVVLIVLVQLLFKRCTDWRSAMLILLSAAIAFVENSMVAVCRSWYAFIYTGPTLKGNICTEMTGLSISPFFLLTLILFGLVVLGFMWARKVGDSYSPQGYFIAYQKPGSMGFWKLIATFFTFPYSGKCWIVDGIGMKYSKGEIVYFDPDLSNYKLLRIEDKPDVWLGKKWQLFKNCAL
jgi:hypothetical protein